MEILDYTLVLTVIYLSMDPKTHDYTYFDSVNNKFKEVKWVITILMEYVQIKLIYVNWK